MVSSWGLSSGLDQRFDIIDYNCAEQPRNASRSILQSLQSPSWIPGNALLKVRRAQRERYWVKPGFCSKQWCNMSFTSTWWPMKQNSPWSIKHKTCKLHHLLNYVIYKAINAVALAFRRYTSSLDFVSCHFGDSLSSKMINHFTKSLNFSIIWKMTYWLPIRL